MIARWKVLKSELIKSTGFFRLRVDECELPDGRINPRYYVFEWPAWVNVVGLTDDGQIVMIEQYRHGAGEIFLEVPGGGTNGEDPQVGGAREFREETGYEAREWIDCGFVYPNPAMQNNKMHTFLALGCKKVGEQAQDPFEDIQVKLMPIKEVLGKLERGEIHHALVASSLHLAFKQMRDRGLLK